MRDINIEQILVASASDDNIAQLLRKQMRTQRAQALRETLFRRISSDSGESLITSLLLIPVVFFVIVAIIDIGLFFMTDSAIAKEAREGAETVGTLGGTGTSYRLAPTEVSYDQRATKTDLDNATATYGFTVRNTPELLVAQSIMGTTSDPESASSSVYGASITNINCRVETGTSTSTRANWLGDRPECRVYWQYDSGLPVSAFGFIGEQERVAVGTSTADYIVQGDYERGELRQ